MNIMFYSGQKVICIDDDWNSSTIDVKEIQFIPKKDQIYTVEKCERIDKCTDNYITLFECPNREVSRGNGWFTALAFNSKGFRPLDQRGTDISVFKGLLTPTLLDKLKELEELFPWVTERQEPKQQK